MVPQIGPKSLTNMLFCPRASFGWILGRFGINLVQFLCALGDLGLPFWYHLMAFAPDIGLVSMTSPRFFGHRFGMCFLQDIIGFGTENGSEMVHLDTILHELFVKASRHSRDLMNISGQLLGMELLGIP